ncbi:hypothetical protein [Polymorphospora sp. NPDC050346]|uniref:hypothetical protein n=1 Tax=Polymorphospora sp. NPDC050346 TaxID=3155780 RepID=UPI0034001AB5
MLIEHGTVASGHYPANIAAYRNRPHTRGVNGSARLRPGPVADASTATAARYQQRRNRDHEAGDSGQPASNLDTPYAEQDGGHAQADRHDASDSKDRPMPRMSHGLMVPFATYYRSHPFYYK